jgi:dihydroxyacid dehydratase/phosphogluconate dehydratase
MARCWIGTMSGNWNHWELADKVAEGVLSADTTPIEAHTIAIHGDITIGPETVKTLLVNREISADSICPGAGVCGGELIANTMAMAYEVLGSSPMGWNDIPASDPLKVAAAARASLPVFGAAGLALPNPTPSLSATGHQGGADYASPGHIRQEGN